MEDLMKQLRTMARDGYAPAIWAVQEIERLRAALNKMEDEKFEYGQARYNDGYEAGRAETSNSE